MFLVRAGGVNGEEKQDKHVRELDANFLSVKRRHADGSRWPESICLHLRFLEVMLSCLNSVLFSEVFTYGIII